MGDSANTYSSLKPMFKEAYANKLMKTHSKPGKEHFKLLKKYLKK